MHKTDSALWTGTGSVILAGAVYLLLHDSESDVLRVVLTLLALLIPVGILAWLEKPQAWLGESPAPVVIFLSGAAGLTIWTISWWLMFLLNDQLIDAVGVYRPVFAVMDSWALEVIYRVVMLPTASAIVIFGMMRANLTGLKQIALMALYLAMISIMTTPQGLVGLVGYGLMGLIAGFLAVRTRSLWAGLAAHMVFMYANSALLDNLILDFGDTYFQTDWLTLVLVSAFLTLVLTQVIRFRTESRIIPNQGISRMGWVALVGVLLVLTFYTASEINQRNEFETANNRQETAIRSPETGIR